MHILITDSGVGGLSVCAYAERFVRTHGWREPVHLTFANAAPANDFGYNSMRSREEKLATFDRFLRNVANRFAPDAIYVACNTLSVLMPDTPYVQTARIPVQGIVATATELVARALRSDPRSVTMIFATQTTIDSGAYPRMLEAMGIDASRIIGQACPGLADTISEDRQGARTAAEIRAWVNTALEKLPRHDAPVVACLACTHYGYRKELFAAAFREAGIDATIINPNENAVADIFGEDRGSIHEVDVQFMTRYAIPAATVETLTFLLSEVSPRTVAAMQHFVHVPDLF